MVYLISVPGVPRPQPRPRFVRGRVVSTADANARRWIASVVAAAARVAREKGKATGPLSATMGFTFPTKDQSRWRNPHLSRPDADNLAKLVLDALMKAGLIQDDSTVSCLSVVKAWGSQADAGLVLTIGPHRMLPVPPKEMDRPDWI